MKYLYLQYLQPGRPTGQKPLIPAPESPSMLHALGLSITDIGLHALGGGISSPYCTVSIVNVSYLIRI
jgi:acetyl-CoA acetyltransferase